MFDKVFVISYINNFEHRKNISDKLNNLGIDFEFIYGPNLYDIPTFCNVDVQCDQLKKDDRHNDYYIHQVSGSQAHLMAVDYAYNGGYNNVLIIEDDVHFIKNKEFILDCLNNYPKDADLIQYGYINIFNFQSDNLFIKNFYMPGAQMYALCNRNIMKVYLDSQHNYYSVADNIFLFKTKSTYNRYITIPQIAIDLDHIDNVNNLENYD